MLQPRPLLAFLMAAPLALALILPAAAQIMPGGSKRNSNQPIEIASDNLEVLQDKQLAIFRGNVDVAQGDMRMRSDQLYVHYRDEQQQARPAVGARPAQNPAPALAPGGPDMGSIRLIEAKGKVFLSSATEKAQGDEAVYDVEKKIVTLTGSVVLTNDRGVLRCAKVVMFQDTGRSTCDPLPGQRVIGVFKPAGAQ